MTDSFLYYNGCMKKLTDDEIHALRYYEGVLSPQDQNKPFWSDPKAYVTFNSLFFADTVTEAARCEEGRKLNACITDDPSSVMKMIKDLYTACLKYEHQPLHVFRVERLADFQMFCREGTFTSFISTSRAGFLENYEDKYDLVLMDIAVSTDVPCIDYIQMVPGREKEEESEVLIAPYPEIKVIKDELPRELRTIKDGRGNPPAVYCHVDVKAGMGKKTDVQSVAPVHVEAARSYYQAMNMHADVNENDRALYLQYKSIIRSYTEGLI